MLTHHRKPVSLSLISTDLPIWSVVETAATLYQKDRERFHLLLHEPAIVDLEPNEVTEVTAVRPNFPEATENPSSQAKPRLLWLEVSPYRVIMTMQGNGRYSYRHLWEKGTYGLSRYWLQGDSISTYEQLRFRNFTRKFALTGRPLPEHLRLEYELWSDKVQLGQYVLDLEVHH